MVWLRERAQETGAGAAVAAGTAAAAVAVGAVTGAAAWVGAGSAVGVASSPQAMIIAARTSRNPKKSRLRLNIPSMPTSQNCLVPSL